MNLIELKKKALPIELAARWGDCHEIEIVCCGSMDHLRVYYRTERCGKALLGRIMWSAFQCSAFAELSENREEQERLYVVGLNAGRALLEAMKAGQIPEQAVRDEIPINVLQRLEGPSNDFVIGKILTVHGCSMR